MNKYLFGCLVMFYGLQNSFAQSSVIDFYNAELKELNTYKATAKIKKQDVPNGFVSYMVHKADGELIYKEMAYFIAQNGKEFVAIVTANITQRYTTDFRFYELQNGTLSAAVHCSLEVLNQVQEVLNKKINKKNVWIKLPQLGTTIQFGELLSEVEMYDFVAICEIKFDSKDGTFHLVQK